MSYYENTDPNKCVLIMKRSREDFAYMHIFLQLSMHTYQ